MVWSVRPGRVYLFSFIDLAFLRIILPNDFIISQYITISLRLPPLKNVISENIVSDVQLKNFFISWESYASFSRYSMFCIINHPINCKVCDAVMSNSTLKRICNISLCHKLLGHQTGLTNRYSYGQY